MQRGFFLFVTAIRANYRKGESGSPFFVHSYGTEPTFAVHSGGKTAMFDLVRNHKRWMLFLVLILILPSFVFFGIEGYARFTGADEVMVRVGDTTITRTEYEMARRNQLERVRQLFGPGFDTRVFDSREAREQTLQQLIDQRVTALAAADGRLGVSDNALRQAIAQIPAVQENGRFSRELYTQALAAQGLTPAQFEASVRYDLSLALVVDPVVSSATYPTAILDSLLRAMQEEREIRLRQFPAADFRATVEVSEADVQQYYDDHLSEFAVPETIHAEYLLLDSDAVMGQVTVNDDEVAQYYEQNKQRFVTAASRRVSHILIEIPASADEAQRSQIRENAEALLERARRNPDSFAELAREHSDDKGSASAGGSLGWITAGMMVPEFEEVAFALQAGEVSELVETEFGLHIIRADEVREAQVKPLEEVRQQLTDEIRLQKAGARFGDLAGQFTSLVYDVTDSLQPIAEALGLQVQTASDITRDNAPADGPEIFQDPRVRQALFSEDVARNGNNSGVIELAPDRLVAVRAAEVVPAHTAPLDSVAADIRERLTQQRALEAAETAGLQTLQKLQDGGQPEGFGEPIIVSRANPAGVAIPVVQAVMAVSDEAELPQYVGAMSAEGYVIASVERILEAEAPAKDAVQAERAILANTLAQAEARGVIQQLRNHYKVKLEPLAAQVLAEDEAR